MQVFEDLIAEAALIKLRNVFAEQFDGGVNLTVEGGFMTQNGAKAVQPVSFGEGIVFKELGLPAVEASQTPGGGGDFFNIVLFEEVARGKLLGPFGLKLLVTCGVFAEGRQDDITGEEAVGGGIAAGDGFAGIGCRHGYTLSAVVQLSAMLSHFHYDVFMRVL